MIYQRNGNNKSLYNVTSALLFNNFHQDFEFLLGFEKLTKVSD